MEYKDLTKVNSEINTVDIKGKAYAEVPQRVQAFRKLFPEGTIETEIVACEGGVCVFKAIAKNGETVLGTGHAYEKEGSTFINKTSYIENCETSAIGRALGFVGIGSETSIASYEEVQNAKANQNSGSGPDKGALVARVKELCELKGVSEEDVCKRGEVGDIKDMPVPHLEACINWLKGQ